jgi:branched-chain amino acid transport system substrate-binding protein
MIIRQSLRLAIAAAIVASAPGFAAAQDKVRVGYAISKSGPNAGGATITQIPNYEMWVKDVNAKGRLMLSG